MFDIGKTYSVVVWDMPVAVFDIELDDYIRNEDGTVKLFNIPNYDYSYICDDLAIDPVDVDCLEERMDKGDVDPVLEVEETWERSFDNVTT